MLKDALTNILVEYSVLLRQFFATLHDSHKREVGSAGLESVYTSMVEKDKQLQQLVDHLVQHQVFQQKIFSIQEKINEVHNQTAATTFKAKETEEALKAVLHNQSASNTNIRSSAGSVRHGVVVSEIVAYGHKISYTTSAPPGWVPTQIAVFKPPAPQDENIRMGLLYSTLESDIMHHFGFEAAENQLQQTQVAVQTSPTSMQNVAVSTVIPPMPKGWKPGDPIVVPPPLKGWKPGDPVYPFGAPTQPESIISSTNTNTNTMFNLDLNPDLTAQSNYESSDSENDREVEWE